MAWVTDATPRALYVYFVYKFAYQILTQVCEMVIASNKTDIFVFFFIFNNAPLSFAIRHTLSLWIRLIIIRML